MTVTSIHSEPALRRLPPTHLAQEIWQPCKARYKALVTEPSWQDCVPSVYQEPDNEHPPPPSRELSSTPPMRITLSDQSTSDSSSSTKTSAIDDTAANDGIVPSDALARMHLVEPCADCCLVTNTRDAVEFAYCVPRELKPSSLDSLEYAWNMGRNTLNTDSRYNIFPVTAELRSRFEAGEWVLLPTMQQLDIYWAAGSMPFGRDFPDIPNGIFEYKLLARHCMKDYPIRRFPLLESAENASPFPETHCVHEYPYRELGVLRSHIHPRFVIWNVGRKVQAHIWEFMAGAKEGYPLDMSTRLELISILGRCGELHAQWMEHGRLPRRRPSNDVRIAPSISSSQQTKCRRATPRPKPSPGAGSARPSGVIPLTSRNLMALRNSYSELSVPANLRIMHWRVACECGSIDVDDVDEDAIDNDEMDDHVDGMSEGDPQECLPSTSDAPCSVPPSRAGTPPSRHGSLVSAQTVPGPATPPPDSYDAASNVLDPAKPFAPPQAPSKRTSVEVVEGDSWGLPAKRTKMDA